VKVVATEDAIQTERTKHHAIVETSAKRNKTNLINAEKGLTSKFSNTKRRTRCSSLDANCPLSAGRLPSTSSSTSSQSLYNCCHQVSVVVVTNEQITSTATSQNNIPEHSTIISQHCEKGNVKDISCPVFKDSEILANNSIELKEVRPNIPTDIPIDSNQSDNHDKLHTIESNIQINKISNVKSDKDLAIVGLENTDNVGEIMGNVAFANEISCQYIDSEDPVDSEEDVFCEDNAVKDSNSCVDKQYLVFK